MMGRKIKITRQLEANDCGPACLHMIARFYGRECSLDEIKRSCEMTRIGISMRDIRDCASLIGLETFTVKVNMEELSRMPCPAILYLRHGHFIVLEKISKSRKKGTIFHIVDPENGRVKLLEEGMRESFIAGAYGMAALFAPVPDFDGENRLTKPEKKTGTLKKSIINIFLPRKLRFLLIALLSLATVAANWAMPLLLKTTIDEGIINRDIGIVGLMLLVQLIFFVGFMTANTVATLVATKTGMLVGMDFIADYFNKIISLPISFFDYGLRTDLIRKLGDLSRIQAFTSSETISIVLAVLNIFVFSAILLYYNPMIFSIFILFSILAFVYNAHFVKKRKYIDYAGFSVNSERENLVHELVTGMHEIKLNSAQKARMAQWSKLENKSNALRLKALYIDNYITNGGNLFSRLRDISLTGLCALMVIEGDMTMGIMMMVGFLLGQLAAPIAQIIEFSKSFQDVKLSYRRLERVYEHPEEPNSNDTAEVESGDIVFSRISFRYRGSSNPFVLKDVDFTVTEGRVTAVVGATGSGKTTLLKLILGFYPPTSGTIYVNGKELAHLNPDRWRRKWGVVMQDGRIFSGTVAENIALSDETPDFNRLAYACKVACIIDKIDSLPMKFNTRIGETGLELSGGEKQRILIARAVYKNPEYLLFDEATSSLDAATERKIMDNLFDFYKGRTVVVIAHRLSTVRNADNIVFMDNGIIAEQGSHDELIAMKGKYHELVGNQLEMDKVSECMNQN